MRDLRPMMDTVLFAFLLCLAFVLGAYLQSLQDQQASGRPTKTTILYRGSDGR